MTETFKAYLAGFIDGEGCIKISSIKGFLKKTNKYKKYYTVRLTIINTDKELLDYIKNEVGYGCMYSHGKGKSHHRQCYTYEVAAKQCVKLLKEVLPFLISKQEQAILAIDFHKDLDRRQGLNEEEIKYREDIMQKIKSLKRIECHL